MKIKILLITYNAAGELPKNFDELIKLLQ